MKPVFHCKLINNYFDDPCLLVRILHEKKALLFDLGDIHKIKPSDLYKITDVFVTHTHMDHFIGFDTLLRGVLRKDTPLNIYGPSSILPCIQGKLKGYTWNLIEDYPTEIHVFAYNGNHVSHSVFAAKNGFRKQTVSKSKSDGLLLKNPLFAVRAVRLDHGIPCLAYSLEEEFHINIDKALLIRKGLSVGAWLNDFKRILREHPGDENQTIRIGDKSYGVLELSDIARITRGQKISYATDIAISQNNLDRLSRLIKGSDIFFCEAYFLEEDLKRAVARSHLTAKTAGALAKKADVKKLELMHFSSKYRDFPDKVIHEAMREFCG
ncbi:MAG: ribonuclease Z [Nitrospirota bacterium]|nr:ribonuclease Z [Nitrospirota bacterium]